MKPTNTGRARLGTRLAGGMLALVVLSSAAAGCALWRSWHVALQRTQAQAANTAILLEHDLSATLDKVSAAVGTVAVQLERELLASAVDRRRLWPLMDGVMALVPEMTHIAAFDARGRQVCGIPISRCEQLDVSEREYFQALLQDPASKRTLFGPLLSRINGRWSFLLVHPLHDVAGGFLGVAVGHVPVENFKTRLAALDLGATGAVHIRTDDLLLAMQHPGPALGEDHADSGKVSATLLDAFRAEPKQGSFRAVTELDGVDRESAYRSLARYPLVVSVGLGTQEALAPWRHQAFWIMAFLLLFIGTASAVVALLVRAMHQQQRIQEELEARVEQRTRQLRRLVGEVELAENRERQQIARDLHDDLGQTLAAARIRLEQLCTSPLEPVRQAACRVAQLIEHADRSTRSLATQLAPAVLYELGLAPALERLGEDIARNFGMQVSVNDDGEFKPLSPETKSILYRCSRELLINAAKHAGAPSAEIDIELDDGQIAVRVSDGGVGFEATEPLRGTGLRSVRERLSYIGGSFRIESVAGVGTVAVLTAPLAARLRAAGQSEAIPSRTA